MVLCRVVPCVDCVCLVTLVGSLELRLVWAGSPEGLHIEAALMGWQELKWVWARIALRLFMQRVPWQDSWSWHGLGPSQVSLSKGHSSRIAEAGASQGVPECSAQGTPVAKAVAAQGALHREALVGLAGAELEGPRALCTGGTLATHLEPKWRGLEYFRCCVPVSPWQEGWNCSECWPEVPWDMPGWGHFSVIDGAGVD